MQSPGEMAQQHAEIRVLSLDVWNTLLRRGPHFGAARTAAIAEWLGVSVAAAQEAVRAADAQANALQVQGYNIDDMWRLRSAAGVLRKEDRQTTVELVRGHIADKFAAHPPSLLEGDKTLLAILEARRRGIDVRIASNTGWVPGAVVRQQLMRLGVMPLVSLAAFSDEVGVGKPDTRIFQHVVASARPAEVLHVGDDPVTDYAGALRCGMQALLLHPGGQTQSAYRTVRSLQDALSFVG